MEAKSFLSSSSSSPFTLSSLPSPLLPQHLHYKGLFSVPVNPQTCRIAVVHEKFSFCTKANLRGNVQVTGVPTSVPVRVAHELYQAGHRYLDVRTPEEFSAGHVPGAINIPYMYKLGSGMAKNHSFLAEVSAHFGQYDEIIVGCQLGKRSLMAATDLQAAGFTAVTDIAGGYAAWTQNGLPTE
ncbi:Rhodanese-like domain-containing protein 15 [Hibiscus syriacus]|uniref:Rhodanese-like domain-containing protein 15 n=1 Tax=Hibiscus syriacus TaxID=106335 RepID=A0A6A2Y5P5_HIBSY|nr:thiosulfate sulfurtransferase 16, chloroplastic-like [Hibiscus syriacus]KAE8664224.1 Rhodanese-like domain-containing protein 15 [Hibiscus syriacus]